MCEFYSCDAKNLHANTIDLYCRWLYQTARADGKPRVLGFERVHVDSAPISLFIDRIKQVKAGLNVGLKIPILFLQDFLMATDPVSFFIQIVLPKAFPPQAGICVDNGKTKERLMTKMEEAKVQEEEWKVLLISRYPLGSTKKWIEENEKDVLAWDFRIYNEKTIYLSEESKVVPF
jgi:hypothetical protein